MIKTMKQYNAAYARVNDENINPVDREVLVAEIQEFEDAMNSCLPSVE